MMMLFTAGALLLGLASGATHRNTTWRLAVAGASCGELLGAEDYVPINATHGDLFVAHSDKNHTEGMLAEHPGCAVVTRHQGRPGREFLVPEGYIPPAEMMRIFELLALEHPERSRLIDLTEEFGAPPTSGGSHIYALKVSDNAAEDEDEPNVLLVGMHHAREIMGPETVLVVARYMLEDGRDDPRVRRLLSGTQVYLAWDWNPDGWNYVFDVDNNWRKNRLPNPDGSFGVDLNRNYPFGWDFSCGGSTQMSSNTYRGPSAASEPEMQTMIAWQASRKFAKIVDLHSSGRDVRQNYASCASLPDEIDSMYTGIVSVVAADMGYVPVRSCCSGGEISFAFSSHGSMSILFEQGRSFQPPYEDTVSPLVPFIGTVCITLPRLTADWSMRFG